MTTTFRNLFAATALLGGLSAQAALAETPAFYPRVVGSGENQQVEYGPAGQDNIVGGGTVLAQTTREGSVRITYLDDAAQQQPLAGRVPVLVEDGQNKTLVYVPVAEAPRG